MKKRKKLEVLVTPVGIAKWPYINRPDIQFNADGVYHVQLVMSKEDAEPVKEKLRTVLEDFINNSDNVRSKKSELNFPIKDEENDEGNPDGKVAIKLKLNAAGRSGKDFWENRPILKDAQNKPMNLNKYEVGAGSEIRVMAEIIPYSSPTAGNGVSLRMRAIQVLKLVPPGSGGYDFSSQEGFKADETRWEEDQKGDGEEHKDSPKESEESEEGFDW